MALDLETVSPLASACLASVLTAFLTPWFTSRADRAREERARRRLAAEDLAAPLRDLRTLLRRRGHVPVSPPEVSDSVRAWSQAWERQRHVLPTTYTSAGSSVRAAIGEVFGAVALVDVRPDLATYPLAEPDFMWQDFGATYIDYVLDALLRWGDRAPDVPKRILNLDKWLINTDRRKPIGQNGRKALA